MNTANRQTAEEINSQQWLKLAYVLVDRGHFQEAMNACERAADGAEGQQAEILAHTLRGAILTASGRPVEAMRELMGLHRRHGDAIVVALYLAEACFLAGRHRRGWKVFDSIDEESLNDSPWREFGHQLRATWEELAELDEIPAPQTVPFDDEDF